MSYTITQEREGRWKVSVTVPGEERVTLLVLDHDDPATVRQEAAMLIAQRVARAGVYDRQHKAIYLPGGAHPATPDS